MAEEPKIVNHPLVPNLERFGLGYRSRYPALKVEVLLGRIKDSRSEGLSGELHVKRPGALAQFGDHLHRARFNLSSTQARSTMAKHLSALPGGQNVEWGTLLEQFCLAVLDDYRTGEPAIELGNGYKPPEPDSQWLLAPLLFERMPTLVFAAGGTGKSTLAAAVALSVAAGRWVVGGWEPRRRTGVLVLDWEADSEEWNDRLHKLAAGADVDPMPTIHYLRCRMSLSEHLESIMYLVSEKDIGLLVVDSMGLALGFGHEGADANESALRLFTALRHTRCASLLIDHVKGSDLDEEKAISRPYGSTYKLNLARSVWELKRDRKIGDGEHELLLINTKVNTGPRHRTIALNSSQDDGYITFTPTDITDPDLAKALPVGDRMVAVLAMGPLSISQLCEELEVKAPAIRQAISRDKGRRFTRLSGGKIALLTQDGFGL